MIEKMTKYSFVLLDAAKEDFLSSLQEIGLVDITRSSKPVDERTSALLESIEAQKKLISEIESGSDPTLKGLKDNLSSLEKEAQETRFWGSWDRSALEEAGVKLHFYKVVSKKFDPSWEADYAVFKVQDDGKDCRFVIAGDNAGFPVKEIPAPSRNYSDVNADIKAATDGINAYHAKLEAAKSELPAMRETLAGLQGDFSRALASAAAEDAAENLLAVFEGFAPAEDDAEIQQRLDKMDVVWFKDEAVLEDNPPIKFKNNKFVRMFEMLVDMYGRPAYDGFDPTPFFSIFFLLFFAFCMGDAGYGLLLVALGLGLKKKLGDISSLVIVLGVATTVIGFLFHTFFSIDISQWKILEPVKGVFLPSKIAGYDGTMVLSIIVGIIHICVAMVVKTCVSTRQKGFLGSLGTWGWTLLIVGGIIVGAFALLGVIDKSLTKTIIIVLGIISAIGIFPLNDIHRNPLANVGMGLWDTYNAVTGLLGDVLSYLRLYALGLAGMMLGSSFNTIGQAILGDGSSPISWVFFILLVVVGHTLNIAMAALGAFVHPLRLNFLEFFKNSGYEAAGRNFDPLKK